MSKKVYIYGLFDPRDNALRYVGKTIKPKTRLWEHVYNSRKRETDKDKWIAELIELGLSPTFEILEQTDEEGWPDAEKMWISKSIADGCDLFNVSEGGPNPPDWAGRKQSPEHIQKRVEKRRANGNYVHSEEAKQKISKSKKGKMIGSDNPFYGRKHTQETIDKIKEKTKKLIPWNKGIPCPDDVKKKVSATKKAMNYHPSEETKKKLSEALKGHKISSEQREKLRLANLGKHPSEETKEKLRQANLGKHHSEETKEKLRQLSTGRKASPEAIRKRIEATKGLKRTDEQCQRQKEVSLAMWQDPDHRAKMLAAQRRRRERERAQKAP